jgi:allophanate hydrolase
MPTSRPNIARLHQFYAQGLRPEAAIEAAYARLAAVDDPGIFITLVPEADALGVAGRLPPFDPGRYPLWGIPFAVKDNIDVAGLPTTAACPDYAYLPDADAPVVARLIAAGAICLGKTNLDQFATGLVGVRSPFPVPRNAFDSTRVPGGSSSGSAIAVAQGIACFALGTDTAGSGRVPAGLNNLVGLKPSLGSLSTRGVVPACRTLDCVSIFASSVDDASRVLAVASGYDALDPYSRPLPEQNDRPLRIVGIPAEKDRHFFGDAVMARAFEASLDRLATLGVTLREVDFEPFFAVARLLYEGPWVAERRAAIRSFMDAQPGAVHPVTRRILMQADSISAADTFEAFYKLAALRRQSEATWQAVDALAVPTCPIAPTLDEMAADPIGPNSRLGTYTNFVNLLDLCGLAVPGPFRTDGFPAGITLLAPRGHDQRLARLGQAFFPGIGGCERYSSKEVAA